MKQKTEDNIITVLVMAFVLALGIFFAIVIHSDYDKITRFACEDTQVRSECPQASMWERAAMWLGVWL